MASINELIGSTVVFADGRLSHPAVTSRPAPAGAATGPGADANPAVNAYYTALQSAISAKFQMAGMGNIIPIQPGSQGNFPYNYSNASLAFNLHTYQFITAMAMAGDTPNSIKLQPASPFPTEYLGLMKQIQFQFSAADQQKQTTARNNTDTQALDVVQTYVGIYGPITSDQITAATAVLGTTPQPIDYVVDYVVGHLWAGSDKPLSFKSMQSVQDLTDLLPNLPASGAPVIPAVSSYLAAWGATATLVDQQNNAAWLLKQIIEALQNPTAGVNGMQTIDPDGIQASMVVPQYTINSAMQQIQNDLNDASKSITVTIDIQAQGSSMFAVSINGSAPFSFGGPILSLSGSVGANYDMATLSGAGSSCTISMVFSGYSLVPIQPQPILTAAGGLHGWYAESILAEAYANWQLGAAAPSGFTFATTPELNLAGFPSGDFNTLVNVLVSAYPTITVNYTSGNFDQFQSAFRAQAGASLNLFGFIPLASGSASAFSAAVSQGGSNSTFSVNFTPSPTTGVSLLQETAYVIGGTVESPAQKSPSVMQHMMALGF